MKKLSTTAFRKELLEWNSTANFRQMPWKGEKDPYKIWLSEVMLQQTRVEQGLPYYDRFIKAFPTVKKLAAAKDTEVFKLWEGLGYYSRCRNLLETARKIHTDYGGKFPATYQEILALKGVGAYTAAAIASFAFNLPHAVVDGNVIRVLGRVFGIGIISDTTEGKKYYGELAQNLLHKEHPGIYNQALMDFGATVCKPVPLCEDCPFMEECIAYRQGAVKLYPVKTPKAARQERNLKYLFLMHNEKVLVRERTSKNIWRNLYEFYLFEQGNFPPEKEMKALFGKTFRQLKTHHFEQLLTHQKLNIEIMVAEVKDSFAPPDNFFWHNMEKLKNLPFPKTLRDFIIKEIRF